MAAHSPLKYLVVPATIDNAVRTVARSIELARRYLDATSLHTLAELDSRSASDLTHGMRTGSWLARESSLPGGPTKARVRVANKLRYPFTAIDTALTNGSINYEHAQVLVHAANPRIINELAEAIHPFIHTA
ncbi:MAG: hypothetical protein WD029_10060 [Microthrixaceae bacterium]